ncbi:MAG: 1-acyl-sn-glycerol-3-phosphate acyltransferase [Planctomycetota bacterium]
MQDIIVEKPYAFIEPHRGNWVPSTIQRLRLVDHYLNYFEGVVSHEVRHIERLEESLRAGHGIILAPNHCRYADPLAMGWIARQAGVHVYAMASWHLFHQGRLQAFAIRMCGGFSVYREGLDRTSLDTAIEVVANAERPLVIFPEGTVFRNNDQISPLLDGVSFLARSAARKRKKADAGRVVIHPVGIKYLYGGDAAAAAEPVITRLEKQLTWSRTIPATDLVRRVNRLSEGLFALREIQFRGAPTDGPLSRRKQELVEAILGPIEEQILGQPQSGDVVPRIKTLRTKLMPDLLASQGTHRRDEIWSWLEDIYAAQIVTAYPEAPLQSPTEMQLLETVERLDEDVNDHSQIHRPLHAILEIGEPIEASPDKPPRGEVDPIMGCLQTGIQSMLDRLKTESPPFQPSPSRSAHAS